VLRLLLRRLKEFSRLQSSRGCVDYRRSNSGRGLRRLNEMMRRHHSHCYRSSKSLQSLRQGRDMC
jgi:hypothetical protein